jgi:putative nucleotidyltransferase with HDIG domain
VLGWPQVKARKVYILVVDDEPLVCETVAMLLEMDGHKVAEASSAAEALAVFKPGKFDVVLTDYFMPGMKGDELAAAIKRQAPAQPIVMLTAYPEIFDLPDERMRGLDLCLAKPLEIANLREAIEKCLPVSQSWNDPSSCMSVPPILDPASPHMTANQMLAKVHRLPSVSKAALELGTLLANAETTNERVIRVLKQDSVLTAKLLKVCNSSAMALRQPVTSVDHAILLLGHEKVSQIASAISFRDPMNVSLPAYAMEGHELWGHSLLAATAAEFAVVGGMDFGVDSSTAFTVGLLHDIGKLIMQQFLSDPATAKLRQQISLGASLVEAEREVLGTDHAEVGGSLAYIWRLPDLLVEAIALHHRPVCEPQPRLSALAAFADAVAHRAVRPDEASTAEAPIFKALGCTNLFLDELLEKVLQASASTEKSTSITA